MTRINKVYIFGLIFFMWIAFGIDLLLWNQLILFHKLKFHDKAFVTTLSLGYYSLVFSVFLIIYSVPYIRYIAFLIPFLHLFLLISENVHFFQYAAFISEEGIRLFFQSKGEVTHLLKTGLGPVQLIYMLKVILSSLVWIIPFYTFLIKSKNWIPGLKEKKLSLFISNSTMAVVLFIVFTIIYTTKLKNVSEEKIRSVRISGTMASHLFLAWKGYFKPEELKSSDKKLFREQKIDPVSVPQNNANIILVLMDSIRADHLPGYGYKRNTTPFIESISDKLIKIKYCYAQANATEKSFPSILLSKYPYFYRKNKDWGIMDYIDKIGYSVGISSSMDLNWAGIIRMFRHKAVKKIFHAGNMSKKFHIWGFTLSSEFNYGVDDGFNVEKVRSWIKELPQPFFLIVHLHSAHYSYEVPKKYEIFKPVPKLPFRAAPPWKPMLNAYDNAIYRVDDAVRELFGIFKKNELLENSAIAITSDHGEAFDEHPGSFYHQTSLYESQVRVPLYFYLGKNLSRSRYLIYKGKNRITGLVDVLPTLIKSAGLPSSPEFEGVPIWGESQKPFETMISFLIKKEYAIRMGKWKYIKNIQIKSRQLFDIEKDPDEKNNIAKEHPSLVEKFEKMDKPIK